jgi:hypothetical protein
MSLGRGDGSLPGGGEGTTTATVFDAYVEQVLAAPTTPLPPLLRHGQIVVVDNLSAHKKGAQGSGS